MGNKLQFLAFAAILLASSVVHAQTGTQRFRVNVPSNMTITAPANPGALPHPENDSDVTFGAETWDVLANNRTGATVVFSTTTPFQHETLGAAFERDVKLDLAINSSSGPANWALDTSSDQTDYAATPADDDSAVQASSDAPGKASFDLTVTFLTVQWDTLVDGNYDVIVTGTLSANP